MSEYQKEAKIVVSAMKADVHPQTARKYIQAAKPPEELQHKHDWRTRPDPLAAIWEPARQMLLQAPDLEAKELFEYLRGLHPDQVAASALRSFQRRVLQWRLQHGPDKEVFFEQEHEPGKVMQLDWTNADELAVTVRGAPLEHLLCHSVLPYSNWSWATRCQSESLLSLRHGLQEGLHQLGSDAGAAANRQQQRRHPSHRRGRAGVQRGLPCAGGALRDQAANHRHPEAQPKRQRRVAQRPSQTTAQAAPAFARRPGFRSGGRVQTSFYRPPCARPTKPPQPS